MNRPKLAVCNFTHELDELKALALANGFEGVDWTFKLEDLPRNSSDELNLQRGISRLHPLEIRYHCAFNGVDLGDADLSKSKEAMETFRRACSFVSSLDGRFVTIHMGLGRSSINGLLWDRTLEALSDLVGFAGRRGICICLENLAQGWSSRPELFEKLIRKSGAGITLDIGHAQVSPSVESQQYRFEDFALPNPDRVFNAHIYHEEREERHFPPEDVSDVSERLNLLSCLPCDWWVLELREVEPLLRTLKVVQDYLDARPSPPPLAHFGIP